MRVRIGILEDEQRDARLLAALVRRWGAERGHEARIESHATAEAFLAAAAREPYSVALLDCYLDKADKDERGAQAGREARTGMDVARALRREQGGSAAILFTTTSRDFAVEGYEVAAAGYLVKPVAYAPLAAALDRAVATLAPKPVDAGPKILLTTSDGSATLSAKNLVWARSRGHYIDLALRDGSSLRVRMTMRELAGALADDSRFCSPARGYLVNLDEVAGIQGFDFVLARGGRVPISQAQLSSARAAYARRTFERMDA